MGRWTPETQALMRRLLIAGLIILALVIGSFGLLRAGVWIPWWVPILAFVVIIVAALARAHEEAVRDDGEAPDIAGRIGERKDL